MDMSANGEISQFVPEAVKETSEENGKVKKLESNFDNFKDFIKYGSEQNQKEGNLSTENIIEAFLSTIDNQRKELLIIEKHLSETIQKLEMSVRENQDASDNVKFFLSQQIEQGMILLREIKITLSLRESREKSIQLQLAKFRENVSLKDSEASVDDIDNNLVKTGQGSFMLQTITDSEELDETSSDEDLGGKKQMELDFVKTILKAAKIRQKMAEDFVEEK